MSVAASAAAACGLCELPVGRGGLSRVFEGRMVEFCCMGCANVYSILLESGVFASGQNIRETEVFRRSLRLGLISNPEGGAEPATVAGPAFDPGAAASEVVFQIGGMWCSACAWLIEHALRRLPGVESAEVFFGTATHVYRPRR